MIAKSKGLSFRNNGWSFLSVGQTRLSPRRLSLHFGTTLSAPRGVPGSDSSNPACQRIVRRASELKRSATRLGSPRDNDRVCRRAKPCHLQRQAICPLRHGNHGTALNWQRLATRRNAVKFCGGGAESIPMVIGSQDSCVPSPAVRAGWG